MKHHKLFYGSSYDRGLDILLKIWPKILEKFPDATLDIAYGWDLFIAGYKDNPERMAWMERMKKLMTQKGITDHGRIGKMRLKIVRKKCGIWAYPTYFQEINCITALECQSNGLVPVTMNDFALKETVGSGIKVNGDIYDKETQETWLKGLFAVMGDEKVWKFHSDKAREFAKNYSWDLIATKWSENL